MYKKSKFPKQFVMVLKLEKAKFSGHFIIGKGIYIECLEYLLWTGSIYWFLKVLFRLCALNELDIL